MTNKSILVSLFIISITCSCKENKKIHISSAPEIIQRDYSINVINAFNDLFLDSMAVEKYITNAKLNDTLGKAIRGFYYARNYEFAWFDSSGLIEQSYSFHSLYATDGDSDFFNKNLEDRLDLMRNGKDTSVSQNDPVIIKTELQITEKFIHYASAYFKTLSNKSGILGTFIPVKKASIEDWAAYLLSMSNTQNNFSSISESYKDMMVSLGKLSVIAKNGGWGKITAGTKKYMPGSNDSFINLIKKRLQISGEYTGKDLSGLFDSTLETNIKNYQSLHGFKPTGIITTSLVTDMNIPVLYRMQQIIINIKRLRWMPANQEGRIIIVNIPEFAFFMDSNNTTLFKMDVVVGAAAHHTTMFSGKMNEIVFSPYWNIPVSIVKKEIIPGMKKDKNYLSKRNMEITGHMGNLPEVRQKPGAKNALGKVKFLFPNSFSIYLHDSPEKGLFQRNERDLSHGCIRLSNAPKLACYLLQNDAEWPVEKIDSAMNSGHEQFVKIKQPIPVIITYFTAWKDHEGSLHFADDIYLHDQQMAQKMFTDPQ